MKNFEFYPDKFCDCSAPPCPPNRDMTRWPILGFIETKKSRKRTCEYLFRLRERREVINNR